MAAIHRPNLLGHVGGKGKWHHLLLLTGTVITAGISWGRRQQGKKGRSTRGRAAQLWLHVTSPRELLMNTDALAPPSEIHVQLAWAESNAEKRFKQSQVSLMYS